MSHTTVEYFIDPYLVEIDDERIIVESSYTEQQPLGEVVVELGGLIPHEVVQRTLETGIDPKLVKLFSADGVLKKVGDLTNCSITHRDGSRILVKGDTEQEVAKAMAKLRVKVDEIVCPGSSCARSSRLTRVELSSQWISNIRLPDPRERAIR